MTYHFPTPVELAFEPIQLCNAACFCCPYTWLSKDKEYRGAKMSREQIKLLVEDYAGLMRKYNAKPWSTKITPWRYSDPLVCPDLEYIFELADKHKLMVDITTNGVSFTEKNCKIIQKHLHMIEKINISIIGFNEEEIKEFMGVSWKVTEARLKAVKENYPDISKKMAIGVKHKNQNIDKAQRTIIAQKIQKVTRGTVKVKNHWITNRMAAGDGVWMEGADFKIDENNFVQGCSMVYGKIFRKIEIMVDGTAVLCCEDATKRTDYGNAFKDGIEKVWNNLREEIVLIYSKKYTEAKNNLICNTCSRAKGNWTDLDQSAQDQQQHSTSEKTGIALVHVQN